MKKTLLATLAALTAYVIFGFSFLFSKLALDVASPTTLLAYRFIFAFLILNLILIIRKKKLSLSGKPIFKLLCMALFQPILYFMCESYGISLTSSSFSGVMIGLAPVAGVVIGALFFSEKVSLWHTFCAVLSIVGVAMTTTGGIGDFSLVGFLCLLAAVISGAAFTAISRSISDDFTPFERTYVMFAMGSVVFGAAAFIQNESSELISPLANLSFCSSVVYLGLLSSVLAFLLINFAVDHISTAHTLILSNSTTVVSVLAGIFILGDRFTLTQIFGIVIIIASVFGVSIKKDLK